MQIRKSSGELVPYNPAKIRRTLTRAGASKRIIKEVIEHVELHLKDGMTTKALYRIVKREIRKASLRVAQRYNLRAGLLRLGPAGFKFEKYVASILHAYQFTSEVPERELRGLCVRHEIDVIAKKDGKTAMIEAKFRNDFRDSVNLKDTMATWARFQDLENGAAQGLCRNFDEVWIVTNGHFSDRASQFGTCKGMHLIGWNTKERSLARMVDHASLYPITVIDHVKQWELDRFAKKGVMLCREIANADPHEIAKDIDIPHQRAKRIIKECKAIVEVQ